jgi:ribonuclease HII
MAECERSANQTDLPDLSAMTVPEVLEYVAGARPEPGDALWKAMLDDPRAGVRTECERILRRRSAARAVLEREARMRKHERDLWDSGLEHVAGVDESGRGPLAGPVVAAAVILPRDLAIVGIDDCKKLTPERREKLYDLIVRDAVAVGVGQSSEKLIDEINIARATFAAMRNAIGELPTTPEHVLVDGPAIPDLKTPQTPITNGDGRSTAIAAASIIAKVTRDRILIELDARYPGYGFAQHKGYGTSDHLSALMRLGPCEIHRRSFRVVTDIAGGLSALYEGFRRALLAARNDETLERIATEIAREKDRLIPHELTKLRTLYKRCRVRLSAGIVPTKR